MTSCWFCGCEMIWGSDFMFEDYGIEGDGIVSSLSCPNCGASADFYEGIENEKTNSN